MCRMTRERGLRVARDEFIELVESEVVVHTGGHLVAATGDCGASHTWAMDQEQQECSCRPPTQSFVWYGPHRTLCTEGSHARRNLSRTCSIQLTLPEGKRIPADPGIPTATALVLTRVTSPWLSGHGFQDPHASRPSRPWSFHFTPAAKAQIQERSHNPHLHRMPINPEIEQVHRPEPLSASCRVAD